MRLSLVLLVHDLFNIINYSFVNGYVPSIIIGLENFWNEENTLIPDLEGHNLGWRLTKSNIKNFFIWAKLNIPCRNTIEKGKV